ncbi:protein CHUP1, chloroplastic-like [Phalaenopsis equestris]|uniref:protein CHUP1, chloroplastic-like n=1 Tax=Phalaenopsis equestris TaxID=78828 RepID=UPI0009E65DB0|nr:protein CHUP1, chloroplastic-like [Phalaenopsis equestris]XP_020586323.1 protein CHUP1, chloroplastic-like [Phalaenopsis equestris]XP_020586324.1 protein CHUP1, chloroplastic-like [Phalaenopsis equestris]XP_020586325.1 protein CHUP1, chloroplastic-like [Phalaenopsis equestris]
MREDIAFDNRTKPCKISQQNQALRVNGKHGNPPKPRSSSSWGSQIVKGFVTDKKNKLQAVVPISKPPLNCAEDHNHNNQYLVYHSRVKRSLIGDFPCSETATQVHPHAFDCQRVRSPSSNDLFTELDHLRSLLRASKDRELGLQSELQKCKADSRISELQGALEIKYAEIESLNTRICALEAEKANLSSQLASLSSMLERHENSRSERSQNRATDISSELKPSFYRNLEMEVLELRRINKELQFQKRNLAIRLASTESQLASLAKSDIVAKVQAEASVLRVTNEDLCKQVEGLQMRRLTEVEELAYLRWVNSCLRQELCNSEKQSNQNLNLTDDFTFRNIDHLAEKDDVFDVCDPKKMISSKLSSWWPQSNDKCQMFDCQNFFDKDWIEVQEGINSQRRHSISGSNTCPEDFNVVNKRRQSDGFIYHKEIEQTDMGKEREQIIVKKHDFEDVQSSYYPSCRTEPIKVAAFDVEKRTLRIPNPPPRPSTAAPNVENRVGSGPIPPPPPPPPPPPKFLAKSSGIMQRAPQVAELYHSLMKRESRKDNCGGGVGDIPDVANVRSSMIGEIENRSSYLLAIKADVETQGEFVNSLIKEVNTAVYRDIEDVVAFVKWLDDELCFLVDERAVLKHFDWPEKKADTLREAAFGYLDLNKLEFEATNYEDDLHLSCEIALKKMVALSEKIERSVYTLLRTRDALMRNCKEFQIPIDWMLDSGLISKIKFASVKLARKYMKRVATELQAMGVSDKGPALEYMLLQGVRFAFRIHQFAGGFDAETMHAFEELRNLDHTGSKIYRDNKKENLN